VAEVIILLVGADRKRCGISEYLRVANVLSSESVSRVDGHNNVP